MKKLILLVVIAVVICGLSFTVCAGPSCDHSFSRCILKGTERCTVYSCSDYSSGYVKVEVYDGDDWWSNSGLLGYQRIEPRSNRRYSSITASCSKTGGDSGKYYVNISTLCNGSLSVSGRN